MDKHKTNRSHSDDEPQRQGDVLGLGGSVIKKDDVDPSTEFDEESIAQRHSRSRGEDEKPDPEESAFQRRSGATGIDMGAGGTGTDVE